MINSSNGSHAVATKCIFQRQGNFRREALQAAGEILQWWLTGGVMIGKGSSKATFTGPFFTGQDVFSHRSFSSE
jgi:hypothetical protein